MDEQEREWCVQKGYEDLQHSPHVQSSTTEKEWASEHIWRAGSRLTSALQDLVQLGLVQQLRVPGLDGLQLNGHLLATLDVGAYVHDTSACTCMLCDM